MEHLPPAPEIIARILALTTSADTSARTLADVVGRDPALAARLLGLANSSFIGASRAITTIGEAIVLLGFSQVRDIAIGVSIWERFGKSPALTTTRRRTLWLHSVMVAVVAKRFAERSGHLGGTAFAAGLLHDIGTLVLGLHVGERYWAMLERAAELNGRVDDLERHAFGCDHTMVGGWLLSSWKLPAPLVAAVTEHHGSATHHGVAHAVALADAVVVGMEPSATRSDDGTLPTALLGHGSYSLEPHELAALYAAALHERDELTHLFDAAG